MSGLPVSKEPITEFLLVIRIGFFENVHRRELSGTYEYGFCLRTITQAEGELLLKPSSKDIPNYQERSTTLISPDTNFDSNASRRVAMV